MKLNQTKIDLKKINFVKQTSSQVRYLYIYKFQVYDTGKLEPMDVRSLITGDASRDSSQLIFCDCRN